MRYLLIILLALPLCTAAQNAWIPEQTARPKLLEGFAQAGYVSELWVVSDKLSYGYSSLSYTGNGFYAGAGLRSRVSNARPLGFGVSVDYLQYTMGKSLKSNEGAPLSYPFARFTPMVYYRFKNKKESPLSFTARGDLGVMAALGNNESSYIDVGLKGCVGYKAYEANLGFNFSQADGAPASGISSKWREQMFTIGLVCYPYRIASFKRPEAKLNSKK